VEVERRAWISVCLSKLKYSSPCYFRKSWCINATPGVSPGDTAGLTVGVLIKGRDSRSHYRFGLNYFASALIIFFKSMKQIKPREVLRMMVQLQPWPQITLSLSDSTRENQKTWNKGKAGHLFAILYPIYCPLLSLLSHLLLSCPTALSIHLICPSVSVSSILKQQRL